MITIILVGLLAITLIVLCFSVYLNIRLGKTILVIEEQIEESLDILDENYHRVGEALTIPVLSDEPVIRNVLYNIARARDAILKIANKLIVFEKLSSSQDNDDDENT